MGKCDALSQYANHNIGSDDDAQPGNPNKNYKNGNVWYNTSQRKVARWYYILPKPIKRVGGVIQSDMK